MITSLLEMLELLNFIRFNLIKYNLNHITNFCWWRHEEELWFHKLYFIMSLFWEGLELPIFADIIKIAAMIIKKTFKDPKKVKRIRNYVLKCKLYLYFLIYQKLLISGKTILYWCQQNLMCLLVIYIYFAYSLVK